MAALCGRKSLSGSPSFCCFNDLFVLPDNNVNISILSEINFNLKKQGALAELKILQENVELFFNKEMPTTIFV